MATDLDGYGAKAVDPQYGNGFPRARLLAVSINADPPKSTNQGSLRILRKKNGTQFVGKMTNSNAKKAKAYLKSLFMPHRPLTPYGQPLSVEIQYDFPFNKSEKKAIIRKGIVPHCRRPDSDNLMKGLLDILSECGYWKDDSQISDIRFIKNWSASPKISLKIYKIVTD